MEKITIINYQTGNIGSVAKKIKRIGYEPVIASTPEQILSATRLILPGVGHFASAAEKLKNTGLWNALNEAVLQKKIPILGICLGMQLMAKHSEEGDCEGFGWIDAEITRFNVSNTIKYKVPHTGWNTVTKIKDSRLLSGIDANNEFYFVHSYYFKANCQDDILTTTCYDKYFTSSFEKDNIFGVQFHPEKSHIAGEKLLTNFLKINETLKQLQNPETLQP